MIAKTTGTTPKLEKEIEEVKTRIQNIEGTDYLYISDELKDLRNKIMYVHARMEASLGILITKAIIWPVSGADKSALQQVYQNADIAFDDIDFTRKVGIVKEFGYFLKEKELPIKLYKVNDYRKWFSHPKKFQSEINEMRDRKKYKKVLTDLADTFSSMDSLFLKLKIF